MKFIISNRISFSSLFLGLHEKKGVNYILYEFNHSYCFALNLVLKTGDARILAEFEGKQNLDSLSLKEYYYSILSLYRYNLKQKAENKISFIGVDCELQNTGVKSNVQNDYLSAIKYLKKIALRSLPGEIEYLFDEILKSTDYMILKDLSSGLKEVSKMHIPELLVCFGDLYKDYYIIANSVKYFPGIYRDKEMLTNFNYAIEGIAKQNSSIKPRFFGSLGYAHVKTGNNNSFASILNRSKMFKNEVSFIATGYYNCLSTYNEFRPVIWKGASISGLKVKEQNMANDLVEKVALSTKKSIILLSDFQKLPIGQLDFLKRYDALLIYNEF